MLALVNEFVNGSLNFAQLSVLGVSELWTWARIFICFSKSHLLSHLRPKFPEAAQHPGKLGGDATCFQPRAPSEW